MKRQLVSKTFVEQKCQKLGKQLRCRFEESLSHEIEGLARNTQRSFKALEARLARLEKKLGKKR